MKITQLSIIGLLMASSASAVNVRKHHSHHKQQNSILGQTISEINASSHLNQRQMAINSQFQTLSELEELVKYSKQEEQK